MKKRIALALGMIMMILMLGACGTDPTTVDYNGKSYDDLQADMDNSVSMIQGLTDLFTQNNLNPEELPDGLADQLIQAYGVTEEQIAASAKWQDILDEFGELKSVEDKTFTVTKSGKTLTTDETLKFEKKDVNFEVVYDYYSMDITGISVDPIYTLGEQMSKAGIYTLISMGIVFLVLILISLLIACFNIFPYLEKKKEQKKLAVSSVSGKPEQETEPAAAGAGSAPQTDDTELIAVIAAAIAASTGTSTSDFVVRSINRR